MQDLVKWAAIAAVIVLCITLFVTNPFFGFFNDGMSVVNNFSAYVTEFINTVGSTFLYARKMLNNFLPADLVTITIVLTLSRKPLMWVLETASNSIRGLYR